MNFLNIVWKSGHDCDKVLMSPWERNELTMVIEENNLEHTVAFATKHFTAYLQALLNSYVSAFLLVF